MKKYRFKSENHKQEFRANMWDFHDPEDTFNESIVAWLDEEGLEEFYIDGIDDEYWLFDLNGRRAEIMFNGQPLLFHFYPEDVYHYLTVV